MKRTVGLIIVLSIILSAILGLTACKPNTPKEPAKLPTPTVTLTGDLASWSPVEGAVGYELSIGFRTVKYDSSVTSYKLSAGDMLLVRALGDGISYLDSDWSEPVKYGEKPSDPPTPKLDTPVLSLSGAVASWTAVEGADGYELCFDTETVISVGADVTSYTLTEGQRLIVRAVSTSGDYASSDWSGPVIYGDAGGDGSGCIAHKDDNSDGKCDECEVSVIVIIDFYAINDIHGKFCDTGSQPGVDELATYLKGREDIDDNVVVLSSGDMWQGTAESSLTYGAIMTEWMNIVGTVSMTLGNHEFDWGEEYIRSNLEIADFPFLAINIYDLSTGERADYCKPSVMIDEGGIQIGIIGAIGDCYSSILAEMVEGVEFKVGRELTSLVEAEADRLRALGADLIVYSLHDGTSGYDYSLSDGYVDLVFEGHTHTAYTKTDAYGVYHVQGGGENEGISHAEVSVNSVTGEVSVNEADVVYSSVYSSFEDDPETEALEEKYRDIIDMATKPLGKVSTALSDSAVEALVAQLYYEAGVEKWGDEYGIVLGGGFLKTRSPYDLHSGNVTYGDLLSILPFNNQLVLCSVSGQKLIDKFINTGKDYSVYPTVSQSTIDPSGTYYIVVDTYTSAYAPNGLTEIERYDETTYARDLLAEYIKEGNLDGAHKSCAEKTLAEIIEIGNSLPLGSTTTATYHVTGTVRAIASTTYGNLYFTDNDGNEIYVYGLYDEDGNIYNAMADKPEAGDVLTLCAKVQNYNNGGSSLLELKSAVIVTRGSEPTPPQEEPDELDTPTLTLSGSTASWNAVDGAVGYEVEINGTSTTYGTSVTYVALSHGDTLRVRALGDGTDYESVGAWSAAVTYTAPTTPLDAPIVTLSGAVASWGAVDGAVGYEVKINSAAPISTTATSYTLNNGESISVRAIAATGSLNTDSAWSAAITYTAPTTPLDAPVVTLSGAVASWGAVDGAIGYEVKINSATPISTTATSYTLSNGESISVRAIAAAGSLNTDSAWSAAVTYTAPTTPLDAPIVTLSGAIASWGAVDGAVGYEVKINSAAPISTTATSYTLNNGESISVRAIAAAGSLNTDSAWSAAVTYTAPQACEHSDTNNDGKCDDCSVTVIVVIDFYSINDLHGKFCDTDTQPGVDELASYLKGREDIDDNVVVLSAGDMWQGSAESNLTYGQLMTEWMNIVGTVAMTLGNHEFDWGEEYIRTNLAVADFPFLAINIYDLSTGELADYCAPSIMIDEGGIQIGIIGAIGDCYSSILAEMVEGVEFKVGSELTALVKAESDRLRAAGADIIVYSLHDGTGGYDYSLSSGNYVDLVFEGHTHTSYCTEDAYGVFHVQAGGENKGISHAELTFNIANLGLTVTSSRVIPSSEYSLYEDDPETEALEDEYREIIDMATKVIGKVSQALDDTEVEALVAQLYYEAGVKKWGSQYNIVLGGGFLRTRTPYNLSAGNVTYADLLSLLPFNNQLVLCSVSGQNLLNQFINTSSSDYYIYPNVSADTISAYETYYIVVDTYTSAYAPNGLTEIERYDESTYARDLLADHIEAGNLDASQAEYTLTSIADAIAITAALPLGTITTDVYYIKGTISSLVNTTNGLKYGNMYLSDEYGNTIYLYGLNDADGTMYGSMASKPGVGDEIIVCAKLQNYDNGGSSLIELYKGTLIEWL